MIKKATLDDALKLISSKNYFESIVLLTSYINKNNECYEAYNLRGIAKNKLGFYFYAIEDFKKCLDINSSFFLALENKAYSEYKTWSYFSSIRDCNLSIKLGNDSFSIYYIMGCSYWRISNYEKALSNFDKSLSIKPNFAKSLYRKGLVYKEIKKFKKSKKYFYQSLKIDPLSPKPYIELANIERLSSKNEKALEIYNKFLIIKKHSKYNLPILKSRINLYLKLHKYKKALLDLLEISNYQKNDPEIYYQLGISRHNLGDPKNAIEDFSKAIFLVPKNSYYHLSRALSYLAINDKFSAFKDLRKSINLDWRNIDAYYYLAEIYQKFEDKLYFCQEGIRISKLLINKPRWKSNKFDNLIKLSDFELQRNNLIDTQ